MDKRESENLWVKNNARMLTRLRNQRRTIEYSMDDYRAQIKTMRLHMLRGEVSKAYATLRIESANRWLDEYARMAINTTRGIAILGNS